MYKYREMTSSQNVEENTSSLKKNIIVCRKSDKISIRAIRISVALSQSSLSSVIARTLQNIAVDFMYLAVILKSKISFVLEN